jgi:hypothetical protein
MVRLLHQLTFTGSISRQHGNIHFRAATENLDRFNKVFPAAFSTLPLLSVFFRECLTFSTKSVRLHALHSSFARFPAYSIFRTESIFFSPQAGAF